LTRVGGLRVNRSEVPATANALMLEFMSNRISLIHAEVTFEPHYIDKPAGPPPLQLRGRQDKRRKIAQLLFVLASDPIPESKNILDASHLGAAKGTVDLR
jgi:hypothetical protein